MFLVVPFFSFPFVCRGVQGGYTPLAKVSLVCHFPGSYSVNECRPLMLLVVLLFLFHLCAGVFTRDVHPWLKFLWFAIFSLSPSLSAFRSTEQDPVVASLKARCTLFFQKNVFFLLVLFEGEIKQYFQDDLIVCVPLKYT